MGQVRYSIWVTDRENTKRRTRIGAAFEADFDTNILNLVIGPGVVLDQRTIEGCYISLKPWKGDDQAPRHKPPQGEPPKPGDDDDIPV